MYNIATTITTTSTTSRCNTLADALLFRPEFLVRYGATVSPILTRPTVLFVSLHNRATARLKGIGNAIVFQFSTCSHIAVCHSV